MDTENEPINTTVQGQNQEKHESHTLTYLLIGAGLLIFILLVAGIVIWAVYTYTHRNKSPSIPITTAATSAGTVPDGSNSLITYTSTGSGVTLSSIPSATGCTRLLNSNYVGYKFVNNSGVTQTITLYGFVPGNTMCSGSSMIYNSPLTVAPNTTLSWENNTYKGTVFTFYYNSLIKVANTQTGGYEFYVVGSPSNTANKIVNSSQYVLITATNGKTTFQVVNN